MPEITSIAKTRSKKPHYSQKGGKIFILVYQERWWQAISQNALCKYTNSTEVHPGAKYLSEKLKNAGEQRLYIIIHNANGGNIKTASHKDDIFFMTTEKENVHKGSDIINTTIIHSVEKKVL